MHGRLSSEVRNPKSFFTGCSAGAIIMLATVFMLVIAMNDYKTYLT